MNMAFTSAAAAESVKTNDCALTEHCSTTGKREIKSNMNIVRIFRGRILIANVAYLDDSSKNKMPSTYHM